MRSSSRSDEFLPTLLTSLRLTTAGVQTIGEAGPLGASRAANAGGICQPSNDMENTGLEPVTSWLQTRRSPS
jgi:hypothetical protein